MSLFPFTPRGVQEKLNELYNLPDELLLSEAKAISDDFKLWLPNNFDLSVDQKDFLANMNDDVTDYYGSQCSVCFRHRLDIELIYPNPTPGYAKWPESTNTIKVSGDSTGNIEVTGSLTFTMIYRPL